MGFALRLLGISLLLLALVAALAGGRQAAAQNLRAAGTSHLFETPPEESRDVEHIDPRKPARRT
jgi:hypothetical protein